MIQKQLETQRGSIAYWVNDCPDQAYALVFLHGLSADHTLFEKQLAYFADRFHVLCWDAPAHGKSRPYADFSYRDAAEQLKTILEREQIKRAVLIGQSMGGYVAQTFLKYHPALVAGFIGIDTTPFGHAYYSKSDQWWLRQIEWMTHCYPKKVLVKAVAKSCTHTQYAYENMLAALQGYTKDELCHLMGVGYAGFLEENCDLAISVPVLLLVGKYDRTGKVRQYCKVWHEKTGFPLHIIENAAHNANADNPAEVNREIETFLKGLKQKHIVEIAKRQIGS